MRVIAGEYRRRTLVAPPGLGTRPTADRLRETLFNVLAPRLAGAVFADLYAGSGANGIEALSRGAAHVTFVEQAPPALMAIRTNLAALKIADSCSVEARSVSSWLREAVKKGSGHGRALDIVFLDPPYDHAGEYADSLNMLGGQARTSLASGAMVIVEHRRSRRRRAGTSGEELSFRYGLLRRTRVLEQGDAALSFYALDEAGTAPL